MRYLISVLSLSFNINLFASIRWDYCSNSDGSVKVLENNLYINGDSVKMEGMEVLNIIKRETKKCIIKTAYSRKQKITKYENLTSFKAVTYYYLSTANTTTSFIVCEEGKSQRVNAQCVDID